MYVIVCHFPNIKYDSKKIHELIPLWYFNQIKQKSHYGRETRIGVGVVPGKRECYEVIGHKSTERLKEDNPFLIVLFV